MYACHRNRTTLALSQISTESRFRYDMPMTMILWQLIATIQRGGRLPPASSTRARRIDWNSSYNPVRCQNAEGRCDACVEVARKAKANWQLTKDRDVKDYGKIKFPSLPDERSRFVARPPPLTSWRPQNEDLSPD